MQRMKKAFLFLLLLTPLAFCAVQSVHAQASIRGNAVQASSTSSVTVTWPTGTVSGDLAVIMMNTAYNVTTPTGWTAQYTTTTNAWNSNVYSKVLNSTDITNGHVVISVAGTFDVFVSIVSFVGNPGAIREVDAFSGSAGVNPTTQSTSSSITNTDLALYQGSIRRSGGIRTVTASLGTTLQFLDDGAGAYGRLSVQASLPNGSAVTQSWTYPAGQEDYNSGIIVIVEGAGTPALLSRHKIIDE